jgi:dTDP-4-dehydrorhamnose reductase
MVPQPKGWRNCGRSGPAGVDRVGAMRVLVFGGWGQLGSDLTIASEGRHDLVRPRHDEVEVTDPAAVSRSVDAVRPDAVIDAAAFHKVELCEEDPDRAFRVNAVGALNVARAAREAGARCVYISSDYVFDGEDPQGYAEGDPVGPLNVYGASKVAGESMVRQACPDSLVVRGSGLFGHAGSSGKGGNFVETMLAKAAAGEAITVVDDQFFAPTSTRDMAGRILLLLERRVPPGTYHAANAGSCSWHGFARTIFQLAGVAPELSPRPAGEQAVRRPRSSILLDTRTAPLRIPPSRPWEQAVAWYLQNRSAPIAAAAGGSR